MSVDHNCWRERTAEAGNRTDVVRLPVCRFTARPNRFTRNTCSLVVEVLLYVHRNRRLIMDGSPGRPPRLSHSSWTLTYVCCLISSDVGWHILATRWDQCRSMVQYCFTSTETIRLVRTDSPGRPPRLSNSSWTLTCSLHLIQVLTCDLVTCVSNRCKNFECLIFVLRWPCAVVGTLKSRN